MIVDTDGQFCINERGQCEYDSTVDRRIPRPYCSLVASQRKLIREGEGSGIGHQFRSDSCGTISFPLPPLAEQRRIVAKVEQLMALVDALETQLAASRATAANLLSALVAELRGTGRAGPSRGAGVGAEPGAGVGPS